MLRTSGTPDTGAAAIEKRPWAPPGPHRLALGHLAGLLGRLRCVRRHAGAVGQGDGMWMRFVWHVLVALAVIPMVVLSIAILS